MYVNRDLLNEIADAIGHEALDELLRLKAGCRITIPRKMSDGHWLVQAIGFDAAEKLSALFVSQGSIVVELPLGTRAPHARIKPEAMRLIKDGELSLGEIATQLGISRRTVLRYKAEFKRLRREKLAAMSSPKSKGK